MATAVLTIDVHEEPGWTKSSSPERLVKARLESAKEPKSAEALQAQEKYAEVLHARHLANVQARAARDAQRSDAAKKRRLREAANKQMDAEERASTTERRVRQAAADREAAVAWRVWKREKNTSNFWQRRSMNSEKVTQRFETEIERCAAASEKRARSLGALVERNAYLAKRAVAVAAAVKKNESAAAAAAGEALAAKLGAAADRARGKWVMTGAGYARQVAVNRREEDMAREQKRLELEASLARAGAKRDAALAAVRARAEAANEKARAVVEHAAAEASSARAQEMRREHFTKMNDAEVRRATALAARRKADTAGWAGPDPSPPTAKPPAALAARLSRPAARHSAAAGETAELIAARHAAAEARAAKALEVKRARAALCGDGLALLNVETAIAKRRVGLATKQFREIASLRSAKALRVASAVEFNARVADAAERRARCAAWVKSANRRIELRRTASAGRRAERTLVYWAKARERRALAADRRALAETRRSLRCTELQLREVNADLSATSHLARRAAAAQLQCRPRLAPAKQPAKPETHDQKPVGLGGGAGGAAADQPSIFAAGTARRFLPPQRCLVRRAHPQDADFEDGCDWWAAPDGDEVDATAEAELPSWTGKLPPPPPPNSTREAEEDETAWEAMKRDAARAVPLDALSRLKAEAAAIHDSCVAARLGWSDFVSERRANA